MPAFPFNRTSMELKHAIGYRSELTDAEGLLIEPVWN